VAAVVGVAAQPSAVAAMVKADWTAPAAVGMGIAALAPEGVGIVLLAIMAMGMAAPAPVAAAMVVVAERAAGMVATAVRMLARVAMAAVAAGMVAVPAAAAGIVATATGALERVAPATLVAEVLRLGHHADALAGPLTESQLTPRSKLTRACFPPRAPSPISLLGWRRWTRSSV